MFRYFVLERLILPPLRIRRAFPKLLSDMCEAYSAEHFVPNCRFLGQTVIPILLSGVKRRTMFQK